MKISKCELCGKEFEHWPGKKRRFCSHSCASSVTNRETRAAGVHLGRNKIGFTRPCETCGGAVYVKPHQEKKGHGRYCSAECRNQWQRRNTVAQKCDWCGTIVTKSRSQASRTRFCSWACQVEGRSRTAIDRWHNGRRVRKNSDGYLMVYQPDNVNAYKDGWMMEHRYLVEIQLGRLLEKDEHVHHVNAVRDDNRPENLVLLSAREHQAVTMATYTAQRRANEKELEEYRRHFGPLPVTAT